MKCNFTYQHYGEILGLFQSEGYETVSFSSFQSGRSFQLLLRHDIDFLAPNLLAVTDIERALGLRSINHFLLTSETYNLNSRSSKALLERLRENRHHLGLHVDPLALSPNSPIRQFQDGFRRLLDLAMEVLGAIDSYSFHRPATSGTYEALLPENLPFPVPKCAYDKEYSKGILYRSDSRREWRNGCICQELEQFKGRSVQLLIHPNWWDEKDLTRSQVIQQYVDSVVQLTQSYLSNNLSFYPRVEQCIDTFFLR